MMGAVDDRSPHDTVLSRKLAHLMDDAVTVPGTKIGIGLDAVIGLLPGIGDALGSTLSGVIVYDAVRARVPMLVLARMAWNLLLDAALGIVPFAGDLLDVAHRANRKNYRLLEHELEGHPVREAPTVGYVVGAVALMVLPLLAGLAATVLGLWLIWRWVS